MERYLAEFWYLLREDEQCLQLPSKWLMVS